MELSMTQTDKGNNWKCEVAAIEGKAYVCCLPACQQSVDRTLHCALSPRGAGWVAE